MAHAGEEPRGRKPGFSFFLGSVGVGAQPLARQHMGLAALPPSLRELIEVNEQGKCCPVPSSLVFLHEGVLRVTGFPFPVRAGGQGSP